MSNQTRERMKRRDNCVEEGSDGRWYVINWYGRRCEGFDAREEAEDRCRTLNEAKP